MRFTRSLAVVLAAAALTGLVGCRSLFASGEASSTTALSSASQPVAAFDAAAAESACAESLSAFTAADVRARLDAHGVVAKVEPGIRAKADRLGLLCEATLEVSFQDASGEERSERVRVVAHRQDGIGADAELAVLVHEAAAPRADVVTAEDAE